MRLFVALLLPAEVRRTIADAAARLRGELPPARWVPMSNLHLTLRFLGETEAARVPSLAAKLEGCFGERAPLRLRLRGGGCFPPGRPARVAWVGFAPRPELLELQRTVAAAVEASLGLPRERRPFHPHLTLARPRTPWPRRAVARWVEELSGAQGPEFEVARGHLMRSRLGPGVGARHEPLGAWPLAAAEDPV